MIISWGIVGCDFSELADPMAFSSKSRWARRAKEPLKGDQDNFNIQVAYGFASGPSCIDKRTDGWQNPDWGAD